MTKGDRETLFGFLILFGCVLYSGGLSAGLDFIKTIATAVGSTTIVLGQIAVQFRDELGITDWLWTRGIYAVIAIAAASFSGYAFTRKDKKKILGIISSAVGLVSTILTFA